MPVINRSALVMFSAAQMYELINNVSAYSEFLPGCKDSKVVSQSADKMVGSILVSKVGMEKWFTTENTLVENTSISMSLKDGPFKSLSGQWQLTPLSDEACKVSLQLDYEFSSKIVEMAFGKVFNTLTNNMVSAFTNRAKEVYQ
ncbi:type II toxin-antitoxin system RatA family toxin [Thalassomonas sp. M1454]|uniref:type II toxin-antitoxin system RatA family toxin n=1 Tax=Thalassomonas sp. M1454 TaxID=2594477 RepID=UPI00117C9969|nr:type II toxin-antitoxin system RatA family toxin [Thalassomonas sp. M1454]TRX57435.1 type II toxin-antitoxin system RatA family toxin [Thalassomonas sp. M1454]